MCPPCKSRCQSPGLCSVFWVMFLHSLLPKLEGCGMLGLNGEALLEANLLTRHMEKRIPEGIDSPRVSPARTLVSAPHTGSVSVHSEHIPALDGMVVSKSWLLRWMVGETPQPSQQLFDFSMCSMGIWGVEKSYLPETYSDTALPL